MKMKVKIHVKTLKFYNKDVECAISLPITGAAPVLSDREGTGWRQPRKLPLEGELGGSIIIIELLPFTGLEVLTALSGIKRKSNK